MKCEYTNTRNDEILKFERDKSKNRMYFSLLFLVRNFPSQLYSSISLSCSHSLTSPEYESLNNESYINFIPCPQRQSPHLSVYIEVDHSCVLLCYVHSSNIQSGINGRMKIIK